MLPTSDTSYRTFARFAGSPVLLACLFSISMAWLLPGPSLALEVQESDMLAYVGNNLVFQDVDGNLVTFYYDEGDERWQDPVKITMPPDRDNLLAFMLTPKASDKHGAYLLVLAGTDRFDGTRNESGFAYYSDMYLCIWPHQRLGRDWVRKDIGQIGRRSGCLKREDVSSLMHYYKGRLMWRSDGPYGLVHSFANGEPAEPWAVLFPGGALTSKGVSTPDSFRRKNILLDYATPPGSDTFFMSFEGYLREFNLLGLSSSGARALARGGALKQARAEADGLAEPQNCDFRNPYDPRLNVAVRRGLVATRQMVAWGDYYGRLHIAKNDARLEPFWFDVGRGCGNLGEHCGPIGLSALDLFVAHSLNQAVDGDYLLQVRKVDLDARETQMDEILLPTPVVTVLGKTDGKINLAIAACEGMDYHLLDESVCTIPSRKLKLRPECQEDNCVAMYSLKKGCEANYRKGCWDESVIFTPKQAYEVSQ